MAKYEMRIPLLNTKRGCIFYSILIHKRAFLRKMSEISWECSGPFLGNIYFEKYLC